MPVGIFGNFEMMVDAGSKAAGAEGTADIHTEAGSKMKPAKFSDFHMLLRRAPHDQGICTGSWLHLFVTYRSK